MNSFLRKILNSGKYNFKAKLQTIYDKERTEKIKNIIAITISKKKKKKYFLQGRELKTL